MRFPRKKTWGWLLAVVVTGLLIDGGTVLIRHRREYFQMLAQSNQREATSTRARIEALKSRFTTSPKMSDDEMTRLNHDYNLMLDRADHHAAMAHKYERAAHQPWLPVEPDPPPPD